MFDHHGPHSSNPGPAAFPGVEYFSLAFNYGAQKPAFEKLPPNHGALDLQHQQESLSVCSSDRKLDSAEMTSSNSNGGILSYI